MQYRLVVVMITDPGYRSVAYSDWQDTIPNMMTVGAVGEVEGVILNPGEPTQIFVPNELLRRCIIRTETKEAEVLHD